MTKGVRKAFKAASPHPRSRMSRCCVTVSASVLGTMLLVAAPTSAQPRADPPDPPFRLLVEHCKTNQMGAVDCFERSASTAYSMCALVTELAILGSSGFRVGADGAQDPVGL